MGDNVREIPGYYYDKEKKKYFKIQKGTAVSAYSARDVKRRKVQDAEVEASRLNHARQKGRIRRSNILSGSSGGFLEREYGYCRQDFIPQMVASGLTHRGKLEWSIHFQERRPSIFAIQNQAALSPPAVDYHIASENQLWSIRTSADMGNPQDTIRKQDLPMPHPVVSVGMFTSPGVSTSVSIHETTSKVVMTWLAGTDNSGIGITSSTFNDTDQDESSQTRIQLGPGMSRGAEVSIYSSAPAPPKSSMLFAIGSSHGILQIDKESCDIHWLTPKAPRNTDIDDDSGFPKDIFALDFLRNDPSVLLSGGRRGILSITDIRIPIFGRNSDSIRHPSCITHIRQVNDHRIIVAGLNSSLCQYDLRFRKLHASPLFPQQRTGKGKDKQTANAKWTRPILQYPDYYNSSIIPIGFDVDLESGIVAAAQQSKSGWGLGPVHLYSLETGQMLRSLENNAGTVGRSSEGESQNEWVQCIRFARDYGKSVKNLYLSSTIGSDIVRYTWADK